MPDTKGPGMWKGIVEYLYIKFAMRRKPVTLCQNGQVIHMDAQNLFYRRLFVCNNSKSKRKGVEMEMLKMWLYRTKDKTNQGFKGCIKSYHKVSAG